MSVEGYMQQTDATGEGQLTGDFQDPDAKSIACEMCLYACGEPVAFGTAQYGREVLHDFGIAVHRSEGRQVGLRPGS